MAGASLLAGVGAMNMSRELREGLMQIAFAHAAMSTCTRSKVGAVSVDPTGRLMFAAHNKVIIPDLDCASSCPRGQHSYDELPMGAPFMGAGACIAQHAEMLALEFYFRHPDGIPKGVMVFITREPCAECAEFMQRNGVTWWTHKELPMTAEEHNSIHSTY